MTSIQTDKKIIAASAETVFNFLVDLNNFNQLLPQDKVEKWQSTSDQCSFSIKKMAAIGLKLQGSEAPKLVHLGETLQIGLNQNYMIPRKRDGVVEFMGAVRFGEE